MSSSGLSAATMPLSLSVSSISWGLNMCNLRPSSFMRPNTTSSLVWAISTRRIDNTRHIQRSKPRHVDCKEEACFKKVYYSFSFKRVKWNVQYSNVSAHKKSNLPVFIGKYKFRQMLNNLLHLYGY